MGSLPVVDEKRYTVVEIFGPTLQGEGAQAGMRTFFIRFGYCDSRCSWCDSMHAVDPKQVKANSERLTGDEIVERIFALGAVQGDWITFSGGNPCMHDLGDLVLHLQSESCLVNVETQGTLAPDWLRWCNLVTISPKPPSSHSPTSSDYVLDCLRAAVPSWESVRARVVLKVVVFDLLDLDYALRIRETFPTVPMYLSAGTPLGLSDAQTRDAILARWRWLADHVATQPRLAGVSVLAQLHVLLWGTKQGV